MTEESISNNLKLGAFKSFQIHGISYCCIARFDSFPVVLIGSIHGFVVASGPQHMCFQAGAFWRQNCSCTDSREQSRCDGSSAVCGSVHCVPVVRKKCYTLPLNNQWYNPMLINIMISPYIPDIIGPNMVFVRVSLLEMVSISHIHWDELATDDRAMKLASQMDFKSRHEHYKDSPWLGHVWFPLIRNQMKNTNPKNT